MAEQEHTNEKTESTKEILKKRERSYHIVGVIVIVIALGIVIAGHWNMVSVVIGTVVLIIGIAIWMTGSPDSYNNSTDTVSMIAMREPRKIEEFYEAYRKIGTPLGSCFLGDIATMKQQALIWGPNDNGDFLYFWLDKDGILGYLGYSFLADLITRRVMEPDIPLQEDFGGNAEECICYHTDLLLLQKQLKESLMHYAKTDEVLPIEQAKPSQVYNFTEEFNTLGQHFNLCDKDGNVVYEVDGKAPMEELYVYDTSHQEVFHISKKQLKTPPTYEFSYRGEPYGTLEKEFELVRDRFKMELKEGKLKLEEYEDQIGSNVIVTLKGKVLGGIMENPDLDMHNIVFNHSVIIAYDESYLPLLTAMAVMVVRELEREEEEEEEEE